jgi:hypothetical protein
MPIGKRKRKPAVCSPLPMKIFSSVSAVLLSEVTIASPLRAHRVGLVSIISHPARGLKPSAA